MQDKEKKKQKIKERNLKNNNKKLYKKTKEFIRCTLASLKKMHYYTNITRAMRTLKAEAGSCSSIVITNYNNNFKLKRKIKANLSCWSWKF